MSKPTLWGKITVAVKILALSDQVVERLYELASTGHFRDVDLIVGCGDLPYNYLENILTILNKPLMYVPGNHDPGYNPADALARVDGGTNIDQKLVNIQGLWMAGLGGSIRYRPGVANQYSQRRMYLRALPLLSRFGGVTTNLLCSSSPSQCSIRPLPPVASRHCPCAAGFSSSLISTTTRSATRSLLMRSSWVAMLLGRSIAEIGSGARMSTTRDALAVYWLGRRSTTTMARPTVTSRMRSAIL